MIWEQSKRKHIIVGLAWGIIGLAVILYNIMSIWKILPHNEEAFPNVVIPIILGTIGLLLLLVGIGIIVNASWARITAIIISPPLILYAVLGFIGFLLSFKSWSNQSPDTILKRLLSDAVILSLALYTIILFKDTWRTIIHRR